MWLNRQWKVNWIVIEMYLPFSTFQSLKGRWKSHFSKNWNLGLLPVRTCQYVDNPWLEIRTKNDVCVRSVALIRMQGCLFSYNFSSYSRIFYSYGEVAIAGEGLQILTCARRTLPLNSECSLASYTYCDTGQSFIMVISKDPWHSHILLSI